MISRFIDIIAEMAARVMAPFIILFGLYVIFFGHYSPGGGFQGGAIIASGIILLRLTLGRSNTQKKFPTFIFLILSVTGLIIYAGTGFISMLTGSNYLDYASLPLPGISAPDRRHLGILFVEIGVALCVCGTMVTIFDNLSRETSE